MGIKADIIAVHLASINLQLFILMIATILGKFMANWVYDIKYDDDKMSSAFLMALSTLIIINFIFQCIFLCVMKLRDRKKN